MRDSVIATMRKIHGIVTLLKMRASGQAFASRPMWTPCGLIRASLGVLPLLRSRSVSDIGTCVSSAPPITSMGAVGLSRKPRVLRDILSCTSASRNLILTLPMFGSITLQVLSLFGMPITVQGASFVFSLSSSFSHRRPRAG